MMRKPNEIIEYYDTHAAEFAFSIGNVDEVPAFRRFVALVREHCPFSPYVLEIGCGTGRDAKLMLDEGFDVDATDASVELVKIASDNIGQAARVMPFEELDAQEEYDAIWANACLLHLNAKELIAVLQKISNALKCNGVLYASFKKGDFEGDIEGRYFCFWEDEELRDVFEKAASDLNVIDIFETDDARECRDDVWLNVFAFKRQV